jgi:hypothetical protein
MAAVIANLNSIALVSARTGSRWTATPIVRDTGT